jgi:hypothetical protein
MPVRMGMPRLIKLVATVFAVSLAVGAGTRAQSSSASDNVNSAQSIADAARKSREQAKNATKASKVISNDDLDKGNIKPGAQGLTVDAPATLQTQSPTAGAVAVAETTSSTPTDPATVAAPTDDPEIARVKDMIAVAEKDADYLRRDLALQQDTFLSNPDHEHDTAGKAKIDGMQQEIDAKQQDIERLKVRLATLEQNHGAKAPVKPAEQPAAPAQQPATPTPAPPAQP